jgi:antitoxin FitA
MATNLVVRNIDEEIVLALKQRAALHGRSAEAEHRALLNDSLRKPPRRALSEVLANMPDVGLDADFDSRSGPVEGR